MSDLSQGMTRREAIAALTAATAGVFVGPTLLEASEATRVATLDREAATAAGTQYKPKFFTAPEWATVTLLVNYIIPKDAKSGSASDAGVPEFMDTYLDIEPGNRMRHRTGLAWLDTECKTRFQKDFVTATDAERRQVLDDIAFPRKAKAELMASVNWFNSMRDFTAAGFFSSQMGHKDLGYSGNVPRASWPGCPPANLRKLGVSY